MSKILNVSKDKQLLSAMGLFIKVNAKVKEAHGQGFSAFDAPQGTDNFFTVQDEKSKYNGRKIRLNADIPNAELFSLAQELVKAADEPFAAREIFAVDNSFHEGSPAVGFDVEVEQGEAQIIAPGRTSAAIPKADFKIGRTLQNVGKIPSAIDVTRDDVQQMDLRGDRGLGPFVDLMQNKLRLSRKHISRLEDQVIFMGGNLEGSSTGEIQGLFNRFSTTSGDFLGNAPTHGQHKTALVNWATLTADQIIAQIAVAVGYITRNNAYFPDQLVLSPDLLFQFLALRRTSDTDSTPLLEWIKRAFQAAFKKELNIVASNALTAGSVSGSTRGNTFLSFDAWMLMESKKEYQAIAEVEGMTLLPSKEDAEGTIRQITQIKTGGLMVKHPSAMYLGEFAT